VDAEIEFFKNKLMHPKFLTVLGNLNNHKKLGIVSNNKQIYIDAFLSYNNCGHYFEKIICEECGLPAKPSPDRYLAAMDFFNVKKDEILIIEDSPIGFDAAKNAGMDYVKFDYQSLDQSLRCIEIGIV
jgi:HAD superfamily hydrolase (TIGR01509 family)